MNFTREQARSISDVILYRSQGVVELTDLGQIKRNSRNGGLPGGEAYVLLTFIEDDVRRQLVIDDRGRIQDAPGIIGALKSRAARRADALRRKAEQTQTQGPQSASRLQL